MTTTTGTETPTSSGATRLDDPEEDIASLSSSASPEGVTPPQQLYEKVSTTTAVPSDVGKNVVVVNFSGDDDDKEEEEGPPVRSESSSIVETPPLINAVSNIDTIAAPGAEADSSGPVRAGSTLGAAAPGGPAGGGLKDEEPLFENRTGQSAYEEFPDDERKHHAEGEVAPTMTDVNDEVDDDDDDERPLTAEEEAFLLAAYESATAAGQQSHTLMIRGSGAALGDGDVGGVDMDDADEYVEEDPPLTMEDTDSEFEPASPVTNATAFASAAAASNSPSYLDSAPDGRLAEFERRVVLGSDSMLHHRRLPSTIYEESADSTPLAAAKRRLDAGQDLPRIVSGTFNFTDLDDDDDGDSPQHGHHDHSRPPHHDNDSHFPNGPGPETVRRPDTSPGATPVPRIDSFNNLHQYDQQQLQQSQISSPSLRPKHEKQAPDLSFQPLFASTRLYQSMSARLLPKHTAFAATWIGFWALFHITCVNYVLTPLRDAIAIKVGVRHIPMLTLASTGLAFVSSVPIGWLFEAPDPSRRKVWKRMGLTRGETQGTSLALFYRCFAVVLVSYAVGFTGVEWLIARRSSASSDDESASSWIAVASSKAVYVAFFLVVHLMKLHSLSLVWGVTTEAMEYEEVAKRSEHTETSQTRLQRLALVGFGGTLGGIIGSGLASSMAQILKLPGLLILAAVLLEVGAELSIELGRIMQKHWETQQLFQSSNDLASLDASMRRSASLGSMKRVASGNSLSRVKSTSDLGKGGVPGNSNIEVNDGTFAQRLLRGITTILRSRLLLAIFTYNALYASTTVLLSFQRAELVANRNQGTTAEADTAFLANINMASSIAIFALQASGLGAMLAHKCGPRGTLSLMPLIRLAGVLSLAWWHRFSVGQPPNLLVFLVVDECCKIMNLAVAKPVRESLWRGLSNEARYEAKPIVDTLANRWGGGSAAFLVSFIHHTLDWFGYGDPSRTRMSHERAIFGFPPTLFLCLVISAWWTLVSADLGQIRSRIDLELKKRQ